MSAWRLTLAWHGANYVGWQRQPNGKSIQAAVERAASEVLGGAEVTVTASGRTDSGVHALGQVVSLRSEATRTVTALRRGLNARLPSDVACLEVVEAPEDFDPRRWTLRKLYRYRLLDREARCPMRADRVWHWGQRLDVAAMSAGARHLEGRHDFSSFRASGCGAHHPVRTLERARVRREGDEVTLEFTGNGFLRHQVRIMVGTLVDVGRGAVPPRSVGTILAARNRSEAGRTAPAHGLFLVGVELGDGPRQPAGGSVDEVESEDG